MTTAIKRRRGTTTQHSTFTGLEGEITVDTTKDTLVVHDGSTAGGFALLREDLSNNTNVASTSTTQTFTNKTFGDNPTFSAGTANGVAYLNGSKVLTTGSALTFDGTNLGVGTASPVSNSGYAGATFNAVNGGLLQFQNNGTNKLRLFCSGTQSVIDTGAGVLKLLPADTLTLGTQSTDIIFQNGAAGELMRLTSTGLGIGTSSPAQRLDVQAADYVAIRALSTNSFIDTRLQSYSTGNYGYVGTVSNHAFSVITNNTERMRIDSSGNLLVGTASASGTLTVSGGGNNTYLKQTSGSGYVLQTDAQSNGGNYYFVNFLKNGTGISNITSNGTTIAYNTGSDYRLKDNVQPMSGALETVAKLRPVTWDWKPFYGEGSSQGFIAHELQAVVPDCVTGEKDAVDEEGNPVYQGIDTSFLVATLTKAIQEQQEQINQLKAEVAALKGN